MADLLGFAGPLCIYGIVKYLNTEKNTEDQVQVGACLPQEVPPCVMQPRSGGHRQAIILEQQETAAIWAENLLEIMRLNRRHQAVNGNSLLMHKKPMNSTVSLVRFTSYYLIYPRVLESRRCFKGSFYSFLLP